MQLCNRVIHNTKFYAYYNSIEFRYPLNSQHVQDLHYPHSNPLTRGQNRHAGFTRQHRQRGGHRHGDSERRREPPLQGGGVGGPRTGVRHAVRRRQAGPHLEPPIRSVNGSSGDVRRVPTRGGDQGQQRRARDVAERRRGR